MNPALFKEKLNEMGVLFGKHLKPEAYDIYIRELIQFDDQTFEAACYQVIQTQDRFPSVAKLTEICEKAQRELAKKRTDEDEIAAIQNLSDEHGAERGKEKPPWVAEFMELIMQGRKLTQEERRARVKEIEEKYNLKKQEPPGEQQTLL